MYLQTIYQKYFSPPTKKNKKPCYDSSLLLKIRNESITAPKSQILWKTKSAFSCKNVRCYFKTS